MGFWPKKKRPATASSDDSSWKSVRTVTSVTGGSLASRQSGAGFLASPNDSIPPEMQSVNPSLSESRKSVDSAESDETIDIFRPTISETPPTGTKASSQMRESMLMSGLLGALFESMGGARTDSRFDHMADSSLLSVLPENSAQQMKRGAIGQLLQDLGGAKKSTKQKDWSTIHFCAQSGRTFQIKALLEHGASTETQEADGWTPIMLAAQNGHLDAVRELINHSANVNHVSLDNTSALRQAVQNGHLDVVNLLLANHADPNNIPPGASGPLHAALVRACAPLNAKALAILPHREWANQETYLQIYRNLIDAGADVNVLDEDKDSLLHIACMFGDLGIVSMLIEANADVNVLNNEGKAPITHAAYESKVGVVRLLIENGARVHVPDNKRLWTPLHFCAQFLTERTFDTIKLLVENGADVNGCTSGNATALHLVAQKGDPDIIRYLLGKGAKVDARTDKGRTPLMSAVVNKHMEAAKVLISAGADVNAADWSPPIFRILHFAVKTEEVEMVRMLLAHGADPNKASSDGFKPVDLAATCDKNGDEIFMILLNRGAYS